MIEQIISMLVVCIGVVWLTYQITKGYIDRLDKKELPDESEVAGKVLPIGVKFMKDGKVVEAAKGLKCNKCIYSSFGCINKNHPVCHDGNYRVHFKYVKR